MLPPVPCPLCAQQKAQGSRGVIAAVPKPRQGAAQTPWHYLFKSTSALRELRLREAGAQEPSPAAQAWMGGEDPEPSQ